MPKISSLIEPFFFKAGWHPISNSEPDACGQSAESHAAAVITEFGGMQVGSVGAGRDLAASDVCFYSQPRHEDSRLVKPWLTTLGTLSAVASAHNDHMVLFVDSYGRFYTYTDPDACLYMIGHSFSEAMERLLLGLEYGNPIPENV